MDGKCRKCRYRSSTPEVNGCDYILIVKRRRGCKHGKDCARFERGPRIAWWDKLPGPAPARTLEDREFNDYLSDVIGRQGAPVITKRRVMLCTGTKGLLPSGGGVSAKLGKHECPGVGHGGFGQGRGCA